MNEMLADGDSSNIIHSFTGTLVLQGEGTSITGAFLDEISTLISIMVRNDPSPVRYEVVDSFGSDMRQGELDRHGDIRGNYRLLEIIAIDTHTHTHTHSHARTHSSTSSCSAQKYTRVPQ